MSDRSIHGRSVTCTECGETYGLDLTRPDGVVLDPDDVADVYVVPRFIKGGLHHADGSLCDMGMSR